MASGTGAFFGVSFQLLTPKNEIKRKIVKAMYNEIVKRISSAAFKNTLTKMIRDVLGSSLRAQPEYLSISTSFGQLRRELGLVDGSAVMEELVRTWMQNINVRVNKPTMIGDTIGGTLITIEAIQADYADVLNKDFASYDTERGEEIPWLEWLLTRGTQILVMSHIPIMTSFGQNSRTGTNTIMMKTQNKGWGVPAQFSGTPENNYVTRAILDAMPQIIAIFEQEVRRRL